MASKRKKTGLLLACSGGADSTLLLDVMDRLSTSQNLSLHVMYVDHGSPHASKARKSLARRCARRGLPLIVTEIEDDGRPNQGSETRLREARFDILYLWMQKLGCQAVVLGHTADDQAETLLWRIMRGTGQKGLAGIRSFRDGWVLRPMLGLTRADVLSYLRARRLSWVEDPSNLDTGIPRNLVRHELLPWIREHVNPAVDKALNRLAQVSARDEAFLYSLALQVDLDRSKEDSVEVGRILLQALHPAVQARLLLRMWDVFGPEGSSLELEQLNTVIERWSKIGTRSGSLDLPMAVQAWWNQKSVGLRKITSHELPAPFSVQIDGPGLVEFPGARLGTDLLSKAKDLGDGRLVACFDADVARFPLTLRSIRPGDIMRPFKGRGRRKLARILIDAKIPRLKRHFFPVLLSGEQILWLVGCRRSDAAPIGEKSGRVLKAWLEGPSLY
ncbi:MAG: tRNA lysidine(34) synthetase TilS [Deltaproteobacteria bacterium]|nr:tRNA lysidine(34) synthetase TilS [Deltaproteobacteria bacterium]